LVNLLTKGSHCGRQPSGIWGRRDDAGGPLGRAGHRYELLAKQVDHTATTLRSLALRRGFRLRVLAPGLLDLRTDDAVGHSRPAR
jgi:hypothetical protein